MLSDVALRASDVGRHQQLTCVGFFLCRSSAQDSSGLELLMLRLGYDGPMYHGVSKGSYPVERGWTMVGKVPVRSRSLMYLSSSCACSPGVLIKKA